LLCFAISCAWIRPDSFVPCQHKTRNRANLGAVSNSHPVPYEKSLI
jgi:hypothetical protein